MSFVVNNDCVELSLNKKCELLSIYKTLYEKEALCDLVFVSEENVEKSFDSNEYSIKAHKKVLSTYSSYFGQLLNVVNDDVFPLILVVKKDDFKHLKDAIDLIYGEVVVLNKTDCHHLLDFAFTLGIKPLITVLKTACLTIGNNDVANCEPHHSPLRETRTDSVSSSSSIEPPPPLQLSSLSSGASKLECDSLIGRVKETTIESVDCSNESRSSFVSGSDGEKDDIDVPIDWKNALRNVFRNRCETAKRRYRDSKNESPSDECLMSSSPGEQLTRKSLSKPYKCVECGKAFLRKFTFDRHFKVVHLKYAYRCKFCTKSFSWDMQMRRHMKLHLDTSSQV